MLDVLLNEDLWFPTAVALALVAVLGLAFRQHRMDIPKRTKITCGLNLFYGVLIGIMGIGHLQAVAIKTVMDTLPASTNPWFVFPLGFALAIPAWWLVASVGGLTRSEKTARRNAIGLNAWLGLILVVPGTPLTGPAILNVIMLVWKRPT